VEVYHHAFLTSALERSEWSASRPGYFTPRERAPGTHWIGGWVGPSASLDAMEKRKIPSPCWESNPGLPACCQSLYWLSYPGSTLAPRGFIRNLKNFKTRFWWIFMHPSAKDFSWISAKHFINTLHTNFSITIRNTAVWHSFFTRSVCI